MTVRFRILNYVYGVLEVGTRRILRWNLTEHPTTEWTIQQFRAVITPETAHRFVLHGRDSWDDDHPEWDAKEHAFRRRGPLPASVSGSEG